MYNTMNTENIQYRKLGAKKHFAYGCGDLACNMAFGAMAGTLTYFCTDYAGIAAGTVAFILAISRIPDAFSDILMGIIVERTHSNKGKARPWIKRMAIPLALCTVLMFCVPVNAGSAMKAVYLFIAYNLASTICYTALNLPYSTLSSLMTRDALERVKLSSWRLGLSPWGRLIAVSVALPMVKMLGDNQMAWIVVMAFWGAVSLIPLYFCYKSSEEVVDAIPESERDTEVPVGKSILTCIRNPYWWGVGLIWGVCGASTAMIGSSLPYYCKYVLGNDSYYSPASMVELVIWSAMAFITPLIAKKIKSKGKLVMLCGIVAVIVQLVFWLLMPQTFLSLMIVTVIRSIATGPIFVMVFSMMSDVVEYTHWRFHIRQEGMIFSATGIFYKAFSAIATAVSGALLQSHGYISSVGADVVQPQAVIDLLPDLYSVGMLLMWGLVFVVACFWKIDSKYDKIMSELEERTLNGEM